MENFMTDKIKRSVGVLLVVLSVFVFIKIIAEIKGLPYVGKSEQYMGSITVSGKGEVVAIPDIATFSFSVTEEAGTVAEAQTSATEKMNKIIKSIKDSGIDEKDIKTTNYNIYPRYEYGRSNPTIDLPVYYPNTGKQVLAAYVVTQSVEVKVRKTEDAGKLISSIGELGATDVSGLNFSVDKYDDLVKEAQAKAIAEARVNAKKLAKDLGVRLVRVTSYYDQGVGGPMYYAKEVSLGMGGDAVTANAPAPELPKGESKIVSNVSITYEIR